MIFNTKYNVGDFIWTDKKFIGFYDLFDTMKDGTEVLRERKIVRCAISEIHLRQDVDLGIKISYLLPVIGCSCCRTEDEIDASKSAAKIKIDAIYMVRLAQALKSNQYELANSFDDLSPNDVTVIKNRISLLNAAMVKSK